MYRAFYSIYIVKIKLYTMEKEMRKLRTALKAAIMKERISSWKTALQ